MTTSHGSRAGGFWTDTTVSSYGGRSVHIRTRAVAQKQRVSRMAREVNTGVFFPLTFRHRTHRNTLTLVTCKRTTDTFFGKEQKAEIVLRRTSARLSFLCLKAGALRCGLVQPSRSTTMWIRLFSSAALYGARISSSSCPRCSSPM